MQKICIKHNCFLPDNITNIMLIKLARVTDCCKMQVLLAQHPSGLVYAALRSNPHLCKPAQRVLNTTASVSDNSLDKVSAIIKKIQAMLQD